MASLQRTRSLRRPAPVATEIPPDETASDNRSASPSRLPVKFHTRSRSTVTAKDNASAVAKPRPTSTILARSSATKTNVNSVSSTAQEPTKRETSRYPPSTTVTRQQPGHARPGSSGSAAPVKRAPSHTRARSTTASVNASTVLRPPSRDQTTGTTSRTTTTHRRNPSVERSNASSTVHTPTKPNAPSLQPRLRPAFSTLQQHYSPAKSLVAKPLTATYLAPPSPSKLPANVAASAETNRLQAELLQLHLLHRDAAAVEAEWRESAKRRLGERLAKLEDAHREVGALERDRAEAENVLALGRWGGEDGDLDQKIQTLDAIVTGVWSLSDAGGRYARIVRRFERWIDRVSEIEEARRGGTALLQGGENLFISELEAAWKEECPGLVRKLHGWQQQLSDLGDIPPAAEDGGQPASLTRMLRGCESLVGGMMAELKLMEDIEREALVREDEWIEMANREDDNDDTPRAGAIWRSFNGR